MENELICVNAQQVGGQWCILDKGKFLLSKKVESNLLLWKEFSCLNVGPDDATFLLGIRDSVPSTLSQGVASASNTLGQHGTMLHGDTVPCPKGQSCIVWMDI